MSRSASGTGTSGTYWHVAISGVVLPAELLIWVKLSALFGDGKIFELRKAASGVDADSRSLQENADVNQPYKCSAYNFKTDGTSTHATSILPTVGVWQLWAGSWISTAQRNARLMGVNKATDSAVEGIIAAPDTLIIRGNSGFRGASGSFAHATYCTRALADIEHAYLGAGGNVRSLINIAHHWNMDQAGTQTDLLGTLNFTETGPASTAGADDPDIASSWRGAAIGAQVWTQGVAIPPITIDANFENVHAPFTTAWMLVGAAGATTTTSAAAATATQVVPVASSAAFAAGDYAAIGAGIPCKVLFTFGGNTLLLATAQTFASGATVTRYPVVAESVAGVALSGGTINGTPTGTQALAPYNFARATNINNPAIHADSPLFAVTIQTQPVAASFSVAPMVSQVNTDGFVVGFTPGNSCTVYLAAYPIGATQPTGPQLKAGTGALTIVSKAVTAADSLTLAGLTVPVVDLYLIASNAVGDSPVVKIGAQLKAPGTGLTYRTFGATIDAATPYSGNATSGDIEESVATIGPSGAAVTLLPDGNDVYFGTPGRQLRTARLFDIGTHAFLLDDAGSQTYQIWYNAQAPVFTAAVTPYILKLGVAANQDVKGLWSSPHGDPLTFAMIDALPSGLSLVNGVITGTPAGNSINSYRAAATDLAGLVTIGSFGLLVGTLNAPNVFSLDYHVAIAEITGMYLTAKVVFQDDAGPPNLVLIQTPPKDTVMNPFDAITITVSRTPAGQVPNYGLRPHSFQCIPYVLNGDLDMKHPLGT